MAKRNMLVSLNNAHYKYSISISNSTLGSCFYFSREKSSSSNNNITVIANRTEPKIPRTAEVQDPLSVFASTKQLFTGISSVSLGINNYENQTIDITSTLESFKIDNDISNASLSYIFNQED